MVRNYPIWSLLYEWTVTHGVSGSAPEKHPTHLKIYGLFTMELEIGDTLGHLTNEVQKPGGSWRELKTPYLEFEYGMDFLEIK
jgi:hypothetical protein